MYIHEQKNSLKEYTQILINKGNSCIVEIEENNKDTLTLYFIHVLFKFLFKEHKSTIWLNFCKGVMFCDLKEF